MQEKKKGDEDILDVLEAIHALVISVGVVILLSKNSAITPLINS